MATAEVKKIGKPVTTIEYEDQVTLVMNKDEAEALRWVLGNLGNVGGDPFNTPAQAY
jgi:hypothetical protein